MPNHTTNILHIRNVDKAYELIARACRNDLIDFGCLVPQPPNIYLGELSQEDEKDFGDNTWLEWNLRHWGTKWNAYRGAILFDKNEHGVVDSVYVMFHTAWNPPYPVITAIANGLKEPFTHLHVGEGDDENFVEEWAIEDGSNETICFRKNKRKMNLKEIDDFHALMNKITNN